MVLLPQHDMVWLGDNYDNCLNICAHYHVLWNDYYICRFLVRLLYLAWNNHLFVQNFGCVIWSFIHFFVDFISPHLCFFLFVCLMLFAAKGIVSCWKIVGILFLGRICLFLFHGSHFDRWLLWSDARWNFWSLYWILFIIRFPVNFFGVFVERVIYDFSEMFSAPQVFNCILVTRSMVWKCFTVLLVCELNEIWGWQETQNHIHPPLVILELAWGKFL